MNGELPRRIGFWGGSAIMVGIIVGSGIFATPPLIATFMGSPGAILGLWIAGGILSLFGALTLAELATMFPRSGGLYVYINEGLGPRFAFVFGWTYLLLTKPFAAAGLSVFLAENVNQLFGVHWHPAPIACITIVVLTALNVLSLRGSTGLALGLTAFKLLALVAIIVLGIVLGRGSQTGPLPPVESPPFWKGLAPVLYLVLWTYDGWADVAAVAGEVTEPQRRLPRILLAGTAAVILIYFAANAVYLNLVPLAEMRELKTVAPAVVERLLGLGSAKLVTIVVLISILGSSHGAILTGARVTFAQAQDGLLFRGLARVHPTYQTPDVALWVQAVLTCAGAILLPDVEAHFEGYGFTMWIFYGLAAAAVLVLRRKRPDLERPYRCWGYPWVPVSFILSALGMTALDIARAPKTTLPLLGVLLLGLPVYSLWKRRHGATEARSG